MSIASIVCIFC